MNERAPSYVYFVRPVGQRGPVKIGFTTNLADRIRKMSTDTPFKLEVAVSFAGDEVMEKRFHALFYDLRSHGEWFEPSPRIDAAIDALLSETFDFATLPDPRELPRENAPKAPVEPAERAGPSMLVEQLLSLTDTFEVATGIGRTTLSWRVFGDTKKLQSLHDGKDIQTKRLESAIVWFSANWPEGSDWPVGISRPREAAA